MPKREKQVIVNGSVLTCRVCGYGLFRERRGQVHGALAALFDTEWIFGRSATCHVCGSCGYVHWFLPTERST